MPRRIQVVPKGQSGLELISLDVAYQLTPVQTPRQRHAKDLQEWPYSAASAESVEVPTGQDAPDTYLRFGDCQHHA